MDKKQFLTLTFTDNKDVSIYPNIDSEHNIKDNSIDLSKLKDGNKLDKINTYSTVKPASPTFDDLGDVITVGEIGANPTLASEGYIPSLAYWSSSTKSNFYGLAGLTEKKKDIFYSIGYGDQYADDGYDFSFALIAANGKIDDTHSNHSLEIHNLKEDGFVFIDSQSKNSVGFQIKTNTDSTEIGNFGGQNNASSTLRFTSNSVMYRNTELATQSNILSLQNDISKKQNKLYSHTIVITAKEFTNNDTKIVMTILSSRTTPISTLSEFLSTFNGVDVMYGGFTYTPFMVESRVVQGNPYRISIGSTAELTNIYTSYERKESIFKLSALSDVAITDVCNAI